MAFMTLAPDVTPRIMLLYMAKEILQLQLRLVIGNSKTGII